MGVGVSGEALQQDCVVCGKRYEVSNSQFGAARNTCSMSCLQKWYAAAERKKPRATPVREAARSKMRQRMYGLSTEDFEALLRRQGNVCAICSEASTGREWHVDHDHACCPRQKTCGKCVRGILCARCNNGLGFFDDSPERLETAANYIRRYEYARADAA